MNELEWVEWDGVGFVNESDSSCVFFIQSPTKSPSSESIERLSVYLTEEGFFDDLDESVEHLQGLSAVPHYAGPLYEGDVDLYICDRSGQIPDGSFVVSVQLYLFLEIHDRD